jgi:hypothetical protein
MSSTAEVASGLTTRLLNEGYGSGAWHGPDLKAALADVSPELAFWRPAPARHNIAEIALHHAFCARNVHAQLSGRRAEPFVLTGEDWFDVASEQTLGWPAIRDVVDRHQQQLASAIADIEAGHLSSPLGQAERLALTLGITCHAVYHAGQIQLIKRLGEESR